MTTPDPRIEAVTPAAAALVCAVADHDPEAVAAALTSLDRDALHALAVLLAANVSEDSDLARRTRIPGAPEAVAACIIADTAGLFLTDSARILAPDRSRGVIDARHVAMAACRLAGLSSVATGAAFRRDHSTVLHAASRVGENERLRRIARRVAGPYITQPGLLGDELEEVA